MAERIDIKGVFPYTNTACEVCGPGYVWREAEIIFSSNPKISFWKYACTIALEKWRSTESMARQLGPPGICFPALNRAFPYTFAWAEVMVAFISMPKECKKPPPLQVH